MANLPDERAASPASRSRRFPRAKCEPVAAGPVGARGVGIEEPGAGALVPRSATPGRRARRVVSGKTLDTRLPLAPV